ncbi:MAG: hypothetical protein R3B13_14385 [Polyangiaceae bacterium]
MLRQRRTLLFRAAQTSDPDEARALAAFPSPNAISAGLAAIGVGTSCLRLRAAIEAFLILPTHERRAEQLGAHFDQTTATLERSIAECGAAFVAAAILLSLSLLLPALRRRAISTRAFAWAAPSRFTTVTVVIVCALGVALSVVRAAPLVAESDDPIPMSHTFANASLGFAPQVGVQGIGSDALPDAPWLVLSQADASLDGASLNGPAECEAILRAKRMLHQQLFPGQPAPTALLLTVMPKVSAHRLFAFLAAARRSGRRTVTFALGDLRTLERPVLGKLQGVRFTGLRAHLGADAALCEPGQRVVVTAVKGSGIKAATLLQAWLSSPRRPCLTLGGQ